MYGQTYNSTQNILGKNSGVAKQILNNHNKAFSSNYLGYSISLSIYSVDNVLHGIRDYMNMHIEIVAIIKFSLKCETILEKENS